MYIFDIPDVHKYLNDNSDNFLEALSQTEEVSIFANTSIRAVIEMKWPLIRRSIVRKLFIPYLIFLFSFLFYSVVIFERSNAQPPAPAEGEEGSTSDEGLLTNSTTQDSYNNSTDSSTNS